MHTREPLITRALPRNQWLDWFESPGKSPTYSSFSQKADLLKRVHNRTVFFSFSQPKYMFSQEAIYFSLEKKLVRTPLEKQSDPLGPVASRGRCVRSSVKNTLLKRCQEPPTLPIRHGRIFSRPAHASLVTNLIGCCFTEDFTCERIDSWYKLYQAISLIYTPPTYYLILVLFNY